MQDVYIRFVDGGTLRFVARDFDINVGGRLPPEVALYLDGAAEPGSGPGYSSVLRPFVRPFLASITMTGIEAPKQLSLIGAVDLRHFFGRVTGDSTGG